MDDMKDSQECMIKVLLTAVGCPGGVTMINALQDTGFVEVIGTDMEPDVAGRFFADRFYTVPPGDDPDFITRMLEIVKEERPDVVFTQSSNETAALAVCRPALERLGTKVLMGSPDSVRLCIDKGLMYDALQGVGVPMPKYIICDNWEDFERAACELKYPFCFKPTISKGSRGFNLIAGTADYRGKAALRLPDSFPPQLVMELLEGPEYSVDAFCKDGEILMGFSKKRERPRAGLMMYFEIVDRPDLRHYAEIVARELNLDYFVNIQFMGDHLLEVNPRVSTFVHQDDFNMPYLGIQHALGRISDADLFAAERRVRLSRRTIRYHDQVFYDCFRSRSISE